MSIDDVQDVSPRVQYVAGAVQVNFDFDFAIFEDSDLVVDVNGVTQDVDTHYTVTGAGDDNGGTVSFLNPMDGGEIVTIYRDIPIERTSDFQQNGPWKSDSINTEFNRITMILQQLKARIGRAFRFSNIAEVAEADLELSPLTSWLEKFIFINAEGKPEPATTIIGEPLSQSVIGQYLYPRTAAEISAGVMPVNYAYPFGYPQRYGCVGDGVTDDSAALQVYFDMISVADAGTAECSGDFAISTGIFIGPSSGAMKTLRIAGNATFRALNAIDTLVTTRNCRGLVWDGLVRVIGTGSTSYASRTCRVGLKIGDSGLTSRMRFGGILAEQFSQCGVAAKELSTLSDLGNIRVYNCGSGQSTATASLTANWSNKVDAGGSGSTTQTSTIDVDQLPPGTTETPVLVVIGGTVHYVSSVDTGNSKLTVYPWIDTSLSSGTLRYIFGAGVYLRGADAGIIGISQIDATLCAVGLWQAALYGPIANRIVAQYCGVGVAVGLSPSSASVTLQINGLYCENNDYDLVRVTSAALGLNITAEYAMNLSKVAYVAPPRTSGNARVWSTGGALATVTANRLGVYHQFVSYPENFDDGASFPVTGIFKEPKWRRTYRRNSATFTLDAPDAAINLAFGYSTGELVVIGTGSNGAPSGTITFNQPSVSYTVNGSTSAAFTGFTGPAVFHIHYNFATADFTVKCITHAPQGSATFNPSSLADGAGETTTVTVTGAALGDFAEATFSLDLQGMLLTAWVSAADTVSVRFQNETGGPIDLGSGTLRARVRKAS